MTRKAFDERLLEIRMLVRRMGETVSDMVRMAAEGAMADDPEVAQRVRELDDDVDVLEMETINMIVQTIMQESPVASDLRLLTSTLSIVGELEKAGDDATKLAKRSRKLAGAFPDELKSGLLTVSEAVRAMIHDTLDLYENYSRTKAAEIIQADDAVDSGYKMARTHLLTLFETEPAMTRQLLRSIEVFHALEHVADHMVDIAKRLQLHHYRADEAALIASE